MKRNAVSIWVLAVLGGGLACGSSINSSGDVDSSVHDSSTDDASVSDGMSHHEVGNGEGGLSDGTAGDGGADTGPTDSSSGDGDTSSDGSSLDGGSATFTCVSKTCSVPDQYCLIINGGVATKDGGSMHGTCESVPKSCEPSPSCACIKASPSTSGCGSAGMCAASGDRITITCDVP
jgi:hypothetical protein